MKSERDDQPRHVAVVMDGNGRWAQKRKRPRTFGHQAGQKALRRVVEHCGKIGVPELTVFAFSSENWRRPHKEVKRLMELFMRALDKETRELDENNVRLRFIGDMDRFSPELRERVHAATALTESNRHLSLNVAINYGGRWDIATAARRIAEDVAAGRLAPDAIDEAFFGTRVALGDSPDPDLFIRTGGDLRISNFLLWHLAYTELYFTPVLWPDFDSGEFLKALEAFAGRQRRFGRTGAQLTEQD